MSVLHGLMPLLEAANRLGLQGYKIHMAGDWSVQMVHTNGTTIATESSTIGGLADWMRAQQVLTQDEYDLLEDILPRLHGLIWTARIVDIPPDSEYTSTPPATHGFVGKFDDARECFSSLAAKLAADQRVAVRWEITHIAQGHYVKAPTPEAPQSP